MSGKAAWRSLADGLAIAVRVTPRGGRDALSAGTDEHFAARLAAAPVDGAANAGLVVLLILYILSNIVIPNIAQNYLVATY